MADGDDRDLPAVSVVVASFSGEAALERCLRSLEAGAAAAEWVVATNAPAEAVAHLAARFPAARFFRLGEDATVFRLRSLGLARARGKQVALIEDHCFVSEGWLEALAVAHRAGYAVAGGPIDNGLERSLDDWALYLCEYSAYMPPMAEGPTAVLLGANASYDREALWGCHATWRDAFYENEVHDAQRAQGHRLYLAEKACVRSHLAMSLWEAMAHLYAGGRRFGGYRRSHCGRVGRVFWVLAAPAVPLVLLGRIVRRVLARRPCRLATLLAGMPYVLCLVGAWSAGEAVGYWVRPQDTGPGVAGPEPPDPGRGDDLLISTAHKGT